MIHLTHTDSLHNTQQHRVIQLTRSDSSSLVTPRELYGEEGDQRVKVVIPLCCDGVRYRECQIGRRYCVQINFLDTRKEKE